MLPSEKLINLFQKQRARLNVWLFRLDQLESFGRVDLILVAEVTYDGGDGTI